MPTSNPNSSNNIIYIYKYWCTRIAIVILESNHCIWKMVPWLGWVLEMSHNVRSSAKKSVVQQKVPCRTMTSWSWTSNVPEQIQQLIKCLCQLSHRSQLNWYQQIPVVFIRWWFKRTVLDKKLLLKKKLKIWHVISQSIAHRHEWRHGLIQQKFFPFHVAFQVKILK